MEKIKKKRKLTDAQTSTPIYNNMNFSQDEEEYSKESQNNNSPSPFSFNILSPVSSKEAKSPPSDSNRLIKEIGSIMKTKHNFLERLATFIVIISLIYSVYDIIINLPSRQWKL